MDYNRTNPLKIPAFSIMPKDPVWASVQLAMLAGKAIETLAVNQFRQTIERSHSQTVRLLEGVDSGIGRVSKSGNADLRFPFDVMDHATRTIVDNWSALMGMGTASEAKLAEQLEKQNQLLSQAEEKFKTEIMALTQSVKAKDKELVQQQAELEKEKKAKLSSQRSQRKLKAELEANNAKLTELKAEKNAVTEKYDHQRTETETLQNQKEQVGLELAKAQQEIQKLMAEKDGLNNRIEELQRQLEQSSHYTE